MSSSIKMDHTYLLVLFVTPVLLDIRVTKVLHLIQHGLHQCGSKLSSVIGPPLTLVVHNAVSMASIVVESRKSVKKHAPTLHVPEKYTARSVGTMHADHTAYTRLVV